MKRAAVILTLIAILLIGAAALLSALQHRSTNTITLGLTEEFRQAKLQAETSLLHERTALERARLQTALRRESIRQSLLATWQDVKFYSVLAGVSVPLITLLLVGVAFAQKLTTHEAQLDEHTRIPLRRKDLKDSMRLATAYLSTKEAAALTDNRQEAFQMFVQLAQIARSVNRSLSLQTAASALPVFEPTPIQVPSFHELLESAQISPGKPLILGFNDSGQAQCRAPEDIKSMAVAGWQGSGKTLSTAYLVASILYQYPAAEVFVIDPHRDHPKGLTAIVAPLTASDRLHLIHPVETCHILTELFHVMDDRLAGTEPSEPPIFLVVDELPRLAKSLSNEHFDLFIKFLEAATEETRKTNITFIGAGTKWDARNFKNRKDIRAGMPSLLVHKCKPSQADLLLEDSQEKKLVKALKAPGECLLATSHDADPQIVRMPLITAQDIQQLVTLVANGRPIVEEFLLETRKKPAETTEKPEGVVHLSTFKHLRIEKKPEEDIERNKPAETSVIAALNQQCENRPTGMSKNQWISALAKATRYSESYTKNILLGNSKLTPEVEEKLTRFLQEHQRNH